MKTRILVIRLEYDACRRELEILSGNSLSMEKQNDLEKYKNKYEQLKCSVQVKLQLLHTHIYTVVLIAHDESQIVETRSLFLL